MELSGNFFTTTTQLLLLLNECKMAASDYSKMHLSDNCIYRYIMMRLISEHNHVIQEQMVQARVSV